VAVRERDADAAEDQAGDSAGGLDVIDTCLGRPGRGRTRWLGRARGPALFVLLSHVGLGPTTARADEYEYSRARR